MGAGRGRRTGLILIVVIILLLVGGVGILLLSTIMTPPSNGETAQGSEMPPTPVTTIKLMVASRDIRRGTRLTQDDVTTVEWPTDLARPANSMEVSDSPELPGLEQVEGTVARVDILKDQMVLSHMITAPGQADLQSAGSDAALLIPTGQVAVAFPLSRLSGVGYALRTGDHVDVLISYRFVSVDQDFQTILPNNIGAVATLVLPTGDIAQQPPELVAGREENGPFGTQIMVVPTDEVQRPRQVTQLVIKNAIVLRIGDWPLTDENESIVITPEPQAEPVEGEEQPQEAATPVPVVTLPDLITIVMSRQDALVLKYSLETGADIDFALRSALDNDITDVATDSVTLQYLMDFYDIVEPPKLPIAQDPRIDSIVDPTGDFQSGTAEPIAPPS